MKGYLNGRLNGMREAAMAIFRAIESDPSQEATALLSDMTAELTDIVRCRSTSTVPTSATVLRAMRNVYDSAEVDVMCACYAHNGDGENRASDDTFEELLKVLELASDRAHNIRHELAAVITEYKDDPELRDEELANDFADRKRGAKPLRAPALPASTALFSDASGG